MLLIPGLCACAPDTADGTNADTTAAADGDFQAGFGEANITPEFPVGLSGFGNEATRIWTGVKSYIYAHVLAVTDAEGNTALMISTDLAGMFTALVDNIRSWANAEYKISSENILISATHQHSTSINTDAYVDFMTAVIQDAIVDAMEDRAPAEMYINTVQTNALNFVRHYWNKNGEIVTNNHGDSTPGLESHESDPDNIMQLLKFDRGEDKMVKASFSSGQALQRWGWVIY